LRCFRPSLAFIPYCHRFYIIIPNSAMPQRHLATCLRLGVCTLLYLDCSISSFDEAYDMSPLPSSSIYASLASCSSNCSHSTQHKLLTTSCDLVHPRVPSHQYLRALGGHMRSRTQDVGLYPPPQNCLSSHLSNFNPASVRTRRLSPPRLCLQTRP
jgi:hypothetical protein